MPPPRRPAISTGYLGRQQSGIERATIVNTLGGMAGHKDDSGLGEATILDQDGWVYGVVDAKPSTSFGSQPYYAWHEILPDAGGVFADAPVGLGLKGGNGETTADPDTDGKTFLPMYEMSGRTDVPVGTKCIVFRGYTSATYGMTYIFLPLSGPPTNVQLLRVIPSILGDGPDGASSLGADNVYSYLASIQKGSLIGSAAPPADESLPADANRFGWLTPWHQEFIMGSLPNFYLNPGECYYGVATGRTLTLTYDAHDGEGGASNPRSIALPEYWMPYKDQPLVCVSDIDGNMIPVIGPGAG